MGCEKLELRNFTLQSTRAAETNLDQSDFQLLEDLGDDVSNLRAYAGT